MKKKIVVGITGASGSIYAKLLIEKLTQLKEEVNEVSVVFSKEGLEVWKYELGEDELHKIPFTLYDNSNLFAPFSSGSAGYDTAIICPCSMGTLGRIANGISDSLISRTADVMLKERKKLILLTRETPYNLIHIKNMQQVTEAGGIICPASPSFYSKPNSTQQLLETVVDKVLSIAGFNLNSYKWPGK